MFDLSTDTIRLDHLELVVTTSKNVTKGTILHLHGLPGGPAKDYKELHRLFAPRGYRIVSFNYPGLWNASGKFSLDTAVDSVRKVLDYISEEWGDIRVFAESFGGTVIAYSLEMGQASHIFYRAPLPGIEYYTENQSKLSHLIQSISMLVQAGIADLDGSDLNSIIKEVSPLKPIENYIDQLKAWGVKQMVIAGKNDEILDFNAIQSSFRRTKLEIYDQLSHNNVSREQWIEIVTKADIFFQS